MNLFPCFYSVIHTVIVRHYLLKVNSMTMAYKGKIVKLVIVLSILLVFIFQWDKLIYIANYIKGYYATIKDSLFTPDTVSIIYPTRFLNYKRPYHQAPNSLLHCGNILLYTTPKEEQVADIAQKMIGYTYYFKTSHLHNAIVTLNALTSKTVGAGSVLVIPHPLPFITIDLSKKSMTQIPYVKGVYYSGNSLASSKMMRQLSELKQAGINAVVFDVKDVCGIVNYKSHVPIVVELNTHEKRPVDDVVTLIRNFKELDLYVIARIAVFRDHLLATKNPDMAIKSKRTGGIWNQGSKELWVDPTKQSVWDYNIALACEIATLGADEVQFDYIRFPTTGDLSDAQYAYDFGKKTKVETITEFLAKAKNELHKLNTAVSIDIFGVAAWQKEEDVSKLGQKIELLARSCDVISPMLYPSHFNDNFDGYANPGDEPYYFIATGNKKLQAIAPKIVIRPWLQAFKWRVSNYNEDYILAQVNACIDTNTYGYLFWNASNDYTIVYKAFMKKNNGNAKKTKGKSR